MENTEKGQGAFTAAGTNIEEVKRLNAHSGMSYNEVKAWLAQTTGGHGTGIYSDTLVKEVKRRNQGNN